MIASTLPHNTRINKRKARSVSLALSFFLGILLGILVFCHVEDSSLSLVRKSLRSSATITSILRRSLIPILLSVFASVFSYYSLIYLLGFFYAFSFCHTSLLIIFSFQPIGFFVRFFLLSGNLLSIPCMYFYWHRFLTKPHINILIELLMFFSLEWLIGFTEYYLLLLSGWI